MCRFLILMLDEQFTKGYDIPRRCLNILRTGPLAAENKGKFLGHNFHMYANWHQKRVNYSMILLLLVRLITRIS